MAAVALASVLFCGTMSRAAAEAADSPIATLSGAELAAGRKLFQIHCARCHGMLGEGGEGPSLKRATLRHAADDTALFEVISEGIVGTAMPGARGPNDRQLWQIAGYVRELARLPEELPPGDAGRGQTLYLGKGGCPACHISSGAGRGVGPELTEVGLRRNAGYLRRALTRPDADSPMLTSRLGGRVDGFLTVRLVAGDEEYEGLRVSEDEFSVQVRDLSGAIRSFDKAGLRHYEKAVGHSLMPGYDGALDGAEIDDVVSYLMTLKGAP